MAGVTLDDILAIRATIDPVPMDRILMWPETYAALVDIWARRYGNQRKRDRLPAGQRPWT